MGMYRSADLIYGMDLGDEWYDEPVEGETHEEFEWLTWELWTDSCEWSEVINSYLESRGIKRVRLTNYGHHDRPRYALASKDIVCSGWGDPTVVTAGVLAVTDDDARLLQAWELLFPGQPPGEIAWRLSVRQLRLS